MSECFIIMPMSTPQVHLDSGRYRDGDHHFPHVLESLLVPAVELAGFEPIRPNEVSSAGNAIMPAIIDKLRSAQMVLCDLSCWNANVFFELGIRTAQNLPVAMVLDDKTKVSPFDIHQIRFHEYKSELDGWTIDQERELIGNYIQECYTSDRRNALWQLLVAAGSSVPRVASESTQVNTSQEAGGLDDLMSKQMLPPKVSGPSQFSQGVSSSSERIEEKFNLGATEQELPDS